MFSARQRELAELLQTAQQTKWDYPAINEYWEALANPVNYGKSMSQWIPDFEYAHKYYKRDILAIYSGVKG